MEQGPGRGGGEAGGVYAGEGGCFAVFLRCRGPDGEPVLGRRAHLLAQGAYQGGQLVVPGFRGDDDPAGYRQPVLDEPGEGRCLAAVTGGAGRAAEPDAARPD